MATYDYGKAKVRATRGEISGEIKREITGEIGEMSGHTHTHAYIHTLPRQDGSSCV